METYISHKVKIKQGQLCNFAVIIFGGVWNVNTRFFLLWSTMTLQEAPFQTSLLVLTTINTINTYNYQYYLITFLRARINYCCFIPSDQFWSIASKSLLLSLRLFWVIVFFWLDFDHGSHHNIVYHFWTTIMDLLSQKFWADLIQETTACLRIITLSQKVAASWYFATTKWIANWSQYTSWPSWDNAGVSEALSKHILVLGMMNNNHQQKSESSPPWRHETACARSWKYFNVFKQIYIW